MAWLDEDEAIFQDHVRKGCLDEELKKRVFDALDVELKERPALMEPKGVLLDTLSACLDARIGSPKDDVEMNVYDIHLYEWAARQGVKIRV